MKLLELFSGTKSVGKVAEQLGYDVTSLDLKHADINTDVLNLDYKTYEPKHVDVIWASPPCTEYSLVKTTGTRNIQLANQMVLKTLGTILYLEPKHYILENPQTGILKEQTFMCGIPYKDIDYCKYGMPYRKRNQILMHFYSFYISVYLSFCIRCPEIPKRNTQTNKQANT